MEAKAEVEALERVNKKIVALNQAKMMRARNQHAK